MTEAAAKPSQDAVQETKRPTRRSQSCKENNGIPSPPSSGKKRSGEPPSTRARKHRRTIEPEPPIHPRMFTSEIFAKDDVTSPNVQKTQPSQEVFVLPPNDTSKSNGTRKLAQTTLVFAPINVSSPSPLWIKDSKGNAVIPKEDPLNMAIEASIADMKASGSDFPTKPTDPPSFPESENDQSEKTPSRTPTTPRSTSNTFNIDFSPVINEFESTTQSNDRPAIPQNAAEIQETKHPYLDDSTADHDEVTELVSAQHPDEEIIFGKNSDDGSTDTDESTDTDNDTTNPTLLHHTKPVPDTATDKPVIGEEQ